MTTDLVTAPAAVECTACPVPIDAGELCALDERGYAHLRCTLEPLTVTWCGSCGHETAHSRGPWGLACASVVHVGVGA